MIELEDLQNTFRAMLNTYSHLDAEEKQSDFALALAYSMTEGNTQPSDKYIYIRNRFLGDVDALVPEQDIDCPIKGFVSAVREHETFNKNVRDASRVFHISTR